MDNLERKKTAFEQKIKPVLNYVGIIGAALTTVAYVIIVFVLVNGFKVEELLQTTVFAIVNAAVGFVIMQFLKIQGISFAENLPENKVILESYYKKKTKDKKIHSIKYFWATSVIKDMVTKCLILAATSVGIIYIVIQGSNDYNLILLAFVNLIMFVCFGFISLVKAYDFYNNYHIPYILEKLEQEPKKEEEKVC